MSSREEQYKEMFHAEAFQNHEELNNLLTHLEKKIDDKKAIDSIFRITHTLKGNAMGLGFQEIAELSHVMEDIFGAVKEGKIELESDLFDNLFKANDKLGELLEAIKSEKKVSYKGIRTKLSVFLRKAENGTSEEVHTEVATPPSENGQQTEVSSPPIDMQDMEEEEEEAEEESMSGITFSDQVQIPIKKLDSLMNLVGELIIEKDSLLTQNRSGLGTSRFSRLHRITSDIQYGVMDIRLVQVGFLFNKFHRVARDVANIEQKEIQLNLEGTEIEIDRNILKIMSDSLVHLVRNAVSHGIESADVRAKNGKKTRGNITLKARNEKDTVFIDVMDDGAGIDADRIRQKAIEKGLVTEAFAAQMTKDEILLLIFEPGFSNADTITEVSGRGVGMDVVKRATESIGGNINVHTELGKGTTITLELPSSMAVKGALLFEMQQQEFAVPLSYTEAVISLYRKDIHKVSSGLVGRYLDRMISIVFLKDLFDAESLDGAHQEGRLHKTYNQLDGNEKLDVMVVSYNNRLVGLVVDKLQQQKEIVEKTLSPPLDQIEMFSGATILGSGNVCLVLDIVRILNKLFREKMLAKAV